MLAVRTLTRQTAVRLLLLLLVCTLRRLGWQMRDGGLHGRHVGRRLAGLLWCHGLLMRLLLLLLHLLLLLLLLQFIGHLMLWCCVLLLLLLHRLIHHAATSHVHIHTADAVGRLHDVAGHLVAVAWRVVGLLRRPSVHRVHRVGRALWRVDAQGRAQVGTGDVCGTLCLLLLRIVRRRYLRGLLLLLDNLALLLLLE